jgi:UDP-MurNAc hydroxylase
MKLQILSHAGLSISGAGVTLLCDPWVVGSCYWRSWWNYPPVSPELLASLRPDFIYLTHIHWDHFHGPSLRKLGKQTPILLPWEHYPRMKIDLERMGFRDIREMKHGHPMELRPGFVVTSYGFLFPDSAIVAECEGVTVFNANDAKFMGPPLEQIIRRHRPIDFVLASHSSANQRLCYEFIDDPSTPPDDLNRYIARFANFVRATGARYAIPFASNHCYLHKDVYRFNETVQTPAMVEDYFRRHHITSPELRVMVSGDSYSSEDGFHIAEHDYFTRRRERLEEYREAARGTLEEFYRREANSTITLEQLDRYFQKVFRAIPFFVRRLFKDQPITFVLTAGDKRYIYRVDIYRRRVEQCEDVTDARDPIQIHTSVMIVRHCLSSDLFSHLPTSKRVRYRFTSDRKKYLDLFSLIFNFYDFGWLPLRHMLSWRFLTTFPPRWREMLLVLQFGRDFLLRPRVINDRYLLLRDAVPPS